MDALHTQQLAEVRSETAVAIVAIIALNEHTEGTPLLRAMAYSGAILKLVASGIQSSEVEFLARNGSTLLLLLPFAGEYHLHDTTLRHVAFGLIVGARAVDAIQNTKLVNGNIKSVIETLYDVPIAGNQVLSNSASPVGYLVLGGLGTAIALLAHNYDTHLSGDIHRYFHVSFWFLVGHLVLASWGVIVGTIKFSDSDALSSWAKLAGAFDLSTVELVRTIVSSTILVLLTMVAFQVSLQGDLDDIEAFFNNLFAALITYMFVDIYGRNVV